MQAYLEPEQAFSVSMTQLVFGISIAYKKKHVSHFVSSLFAKAIAECNVPLESIKNKDMLTMVKIVKESDEEQMQDTSITSSKLLEINYMK